MLVGDLIHNNDFDCNCNFEIYDCTNDGKTWGEDAPVFSSLVDGWHKPLDAILDMKIKYITTNDNKIIIEASK